MGGGLHGLSKYNFFASVASSPLYRASIWKLCYKKNRYKINKYKIQKYNSKNDKIKFQKFKNDFTDIFTSLKDIPKIKYAILSADEIAKITNLENSIEDEDVIEFYQTLKNKVAPNNLINFYNNIQTLKIVKSDNSNIKKIEEAMYF